MKIFLQTNQKKKWKRKREEQDEKEGKEKERNQPLKINEGKIKETKGKRWKRLPLNNVRKYKNLDKISLCA